MKPSKQRSNMKALWKSDQFIVVRERESRLHGEGTDSYIAFVEDTYTGHVGLVTV